MLSGSLGRVSGDRGGLLLRSSFAAFGCSGLCHFSPSGFLGQQLGLILWFWPRGLFPGFVP